MTSTQRDPPALRDGWPDVLDPRVFEAAFHLSTEAGAFVSAEGTVLAANAALGALVGADPSELVGSKLADFARTPERVEAVLQRALSWHEAASELRIRRTDGDLVPVDAEARLFVTGDSRRLFHVLVRDARARRRRERVHELALAASRAANVAATPGALGRGILQAVRAAIPEASALAAFVHDAGTLLAIAEEGLGGEWMREWGTQAIDAAEPTLLVHACTSGESVFVLDARLERPPHATSLPGDAVSIVAAPVRSGDDQLRGGLLVASRAGERMDFDEFHAVEIAATEFLSGLLRLDATRRLASAESRYHAILRSVSAGVLMVSPDGRILEANEPARTLFGWGDSVPASVAELHQKGAPDLQEILSLMGREERATVHLDVRADGTARYVRVHGLRASEGNVLVVEDATAEVRERRLRDVTAALSAAALRTRPGDLPEYAFSRAAAEATVADGAAFVVAEPAGPVVKAHTERFRERVDVREREVARWLGDALESPATSVTTAPGVDGPVRLTALVAASGGRGHAALVLCHDPTSLAAPREDDLPWLSAVAESFSRLLQHHLDTKRVREAFQREREALSRVQRMNTELEEFTLWTTHDLREPLRSLATLAGYLHEEHDEMTEDEVRTLAAQIERSAVTLKERVRALHAFGDLAREEGATVQQDLRDVVARVVDQLGPLLRERDARVEVAPDLTTVWAQRGRLDLVLLNLVENAVKYSTEGPPVITVRTDQRDGAVDIIVEDNGPGVPAEVRDRIFRLFYRAPSHATIPGTGTGLAIVKRIAVQHGGDVRVEGAASGGARFVVTLPSA